MIARFLAVTNWDPQRRDDELRSISGLTKGVVIGSVSATVVLGYGIALGDQQRANQADARAAQEEQPSTTPSTGAVTPPGSSPTPAPAKSKSPKSKSGGS